MKWKIQSVHLNPNLFRSVQIQRPLEANDYTPTSLYALREWAEKGNLRSVQTNVKVEKDQLLLVSEIKQLIDWRAHGEPALHYKGSENGVDSFEDDFVLG